MSADYEGETLQNLAWRTAPDGSAIVANFIRGDWSFADATLERSCPSDSDRLLAMVPDSTPDEVDSAVEAAMDAHPRWSGLLGSDRDRVMQEWLRWLRAHTDDLIAADVLESGKLRRECAGEVERALDAALVQIDLADLARKEEVQHSTAKAAVCHEPLGVAVAIVPWNFPFSAALRKTMPAMLMGNSVILKPSELTPLTASIMAHGASEVGVPPGIFNVIHGPGSTTGQALVSDSRVQAVSFTGSSDVGLTLREQLGTRGVKLQLEMGGKNALYIDESATIHDKTLEGLIQASFTAAGQWCVALSRLIVHEAHNEDVVEHLARRVDEMRVGPPDDPQSDMGPLISVHHRDRVLSMIDQSSASALTTRDERDLRAACRGGSYVMPRIVARTEPGDELWGEEVFGPVVAVSRAASVDDAIRQTNSTRYGLSAAIQSHDPKSIQKFTSEVVSGKVVVNGPPAFGAAKIASNGQAASGWGEPEGGLDGLRFFSTRKVVFDLNDTEWP